MKKRKVVGCTLKKLAKQKNVGHRGLEEKRPRRWKKAERGLVKVTAKEPTGKRGLAFEAASEL